MLKDTNVTRNKLDTLLYDLLNEGFKKEFRNLDKKKARALPTLVRWCLNHDARLCVQPHLCAAHPEGR